MPSKFKNWNEFYNSTQTKIQAWFAFIFSSINLKSNLKLRLHQDYHLFHCLDLGFSSCWHYETRCIINFAFNLTVFEEDWVKLEQKLLSRHFKNFTKFGLTAKINYREKFEIVKTAKINSREMRFFRFFFSTAKISSREN